MNLPANIDPCDANPPLAQCSRQLVEPELPTDPLFFLVDEAENILGALCGRCHGSQFATPQKAEGSINFIDNMEELLDAGLAIGGDSQRSIIIRLMRNGTMPPDLPNVAQPSNADTDAVAAYLDNPVLFPSPVSSACYDWSPDPETDSLVRILQRLPGEERRFTRFFMVAANNRFDRCENDTNPTDHALDKLLNSRSAQPAALASTQLYYGLSQIDLRDYGWQRPITVDGQTYPDAWEAIAAATPYAMQLEGPPAQQLQELAGRTEQLGVRRIAGSASTNSGHVFLGQWHDGLPIHWGRQSNYPPPRHRFEWFIGRRLVGQHRGLHGLSCAGIDSVRQRSTGSD